MREVLVNSFIDNAKFNRFFKGVLAICMLTTICDGYDVNMFSMVIPSLMKDWHLMPVATGTLASWGMFGMIFGSLFFGPFADAIGKKRAILIGTTGYVVFTILLAALPRMFRTLPCCVSWRDFASPAFTRSPWPLLRSIRPRKFVAA